jgi:2-polyprenyl-3-methyl-5-hydroxy-6-metoxy-1,4-benzoquinol methylase
MTRHVHHELALSPSRDELAAQDFVSALRGHVLNTMANSMKARFERTIAPKLESPDGPAVHKAMKPDLYFRFYSGLRVNAQEMVWDSARQTIERERESLTQKAAGLNARKPETLLLDAALDVPSNVTAIDVHFQPGCYHHDGGAGDVAAGALYENGLSVFSFGLMGQNLDDIGASITTWLTAKYPEFQPKSILDLGCSVGHQTLPWKRAYPQATVTGIDVGAPCLRYAHARAQSQGVDAIFAQKDARSTGYPDASFDLVFSSMFLHELPVKDIKAVFVEAKRLLKPGGLMLHYELPPNSAMSAYDGFYLDWDSYYNNEPWYKGYRDQDPAALCVDAGFESKGFFQSVAPSIGWYGREAVLASIHGPADVSNDHTGRLADGVQWFIYGNWA